MILCVLTLLSLYLYIHVNKTTKMNSWCTLYNLQVSVLCSPFSSSLRCFVVSSHKRNEQLVRKNQEEVNKSALQSLVVHVIMFSSLSLVMNKARFRSFNEETPCCLGLTLAGYPDSLTIIFFTKLEDEFEIITS